jgi:hypothetical protein
VRAATVEARTHASLAAAIVGIVALLACRSPKATPTPAEATASGREAAPSADVPQAASPVELLEMARRAGFTYVTEGGQGIWKGADAEGRCRLGPEVLALPPVSLKCDPVQCAAAGGLCAYGGFDCLNVCSRRTHDGNKNCADRAECESRCLAPVEVARGQRVVGKCSERIVESGCSNPVEKGVARGGVCAD